MKARPKVAILKYLKAVIPFTALLLTSVVATAREVEEEEAVRAVVTAYGDARSQRDPDLVAALFTPDADQRNMDGVWRRDRDAIKDHIKPGPAYPRDATGIGVEAVRFVTPAVAIVDGLYLGHPPGVEANWATIVLVKEDDDWLISAIRNGAPVLQEPSLAN